MKKILFFAALLTAAAVSAQPAADYQLDLVPTGKMLSKDQPVLKGGTYVFHSYPAGTLMSLRRSQVKLIAPVTAQSSDAAYRVIPIGNLAMQGGSTQAGPTNASAVARKPSESGLGEGFYSNLVPGQSEPFPASPGDYQVGRTYASPPSNAVQTSPGAPPTMPSATSGSNPPQ